MTQRTFAKVASSFFAVIAVLHGLRITFRWEAVIAGWSVPLWVNGLALLVAGYLAYAGFRAK